MSRTRRKSFILRYASNEDTYGKLSWGRKEEYNEHFRDGKYSESGRNQGYKDYTNDIIRAAKRRELAEFIRDPEAFENFSCADKKNGKHLKWVFW